MQVEDTESKEKPSFDSLNLKHEIQRSLREIGYGSMFPIQAQSIPPLIQGKDVIGQAHTGSGKTAAFAIPIIEKVDQSKPYVQALVIVPTRELALQVTDEFNKIARHLPIRAYSIYGGQSITPQIERLTKKTPQIVVATPGRLIDHMERGTIDFQDVKFVVLDEADRMLDMGFIDDIDYIMRQIPNGSQTALFSATMPKEILRLSHKYMNHPVNVLVDSDELSVNEIDQSYAIVDERSKFQALVEYIRKSQISSGIVFCATKIKTQRLAERLQVQGFRAAPIHGDLSQNRREHAMRNFREGRIELLVATDVAARGIDVPEVGHVINYDVPQDPLTYFHRIGRTARAGRAGKAISLVANSEYPDFSRIVGMTEAQILKVTDILPAGYKPPAESPKTHFSDHRGGRRFQRDHHQPFRRNDQGGERGRGFSFTEKVSEGQGHFEHRENKPSLDKNRPQDSRNFRRPRKHYGH
ncbi:MAG: DEAD/DEAH box helicase [Nitrososphaerota archaeon]|nr:DEAD/DEAH box helicase [Nitrososphaerota archaeon]